MWYQDGCMWGWGLLEERLCFLRGGGSLRVFWIAQEVFKRGFWWSCNSKDDRVDDMMMSVSEPAYFLQRPEDTVAVAGSDLLLACQVRSINIIFIFPFRSFKAYLIMSSPWFCIDLLWSPPRLPGNSSNNIDSISSSFFLLLCIFKIALYHVFIMVLYGYEYEPHPILWSPPCLPGKIHHLHFPFWYL